MEVRQKDSSHREVQVLTVSLNSLTWFFMPYPQSLVGQLKAFSNPTFGTTLL